MGGILESVAGAFGDKIETPPTVGTGGFGAIFDLAFNNPQLMQIFHLAFQLGESPSALIEPFIKNVVGNDQIAAEQNPTMMLLGKQKGSGTFLDMDALAGAMPALTQKLQDKAIGNFESTYQKLSQVPAFAGLFSEAGGDTSAFDKQFGSIFEGLAGAALGQAAPSGFLHDPAKQANVLGPTALNKAMFQKQLQQQSQAQAFALSGAGGLPGLTPNAALGAQNMLQFQPGVFNAAGLGFQASAANASNFMQQQALQLDQYKAADASLWNITSLFGKGGAMQTDDAAK
jgi:hypothetical protein